jgi:methyl-accepting chemotaxis protein
MQRGTKEVEEGMQTVDETDKSFGEITTMAKVASEEIQAISASTQQQKAGTEKVAKSIDGIASVAEESASASEESASSTEELTASMEDMTARAQELSEMALALQKSATRFKLSEEGQASKMITKPRKKVDLGRDVLVKREYSNAKASPSAKLKIPKKVNEALLKRGLDFNEENSLPKQNAGLNGNEPLVTQDGPRE